MMWLTQTRRSSPSDKDVTATVRPFCWAATIAPRTTSSAQALSNSSNTTSMRGGTLDVEKLLRGRYPRSLKSCCTWARVEAETSGRPFSTFDTVAADRPLSRAIAAIVTRPVLRAASPLAGPGPVVARGPSAGACPMRWDPALRSKLAECDDIDPNNSKRFEAA